MRASILAILILGGIVLNIKARFLIMKKGQAIPPASQPFRQSRLLSQPGIRLYAGWGTLAF